MARLTGELGKALLNTMNHSSMVYGAPKTGKTVFVSTACKVPTIDRIYWFDTENGFASVLSMGYTEQELAKFILIKIPDTREVPQAITTILKSFTARMPIKICDKHGAVVCKECKENFEEFSLGALTKRDLIVIDSGSQLGISALNLACLGKPVDYKPLLDDYGSASKMLSDIFTIIQQAANTNFVVITQELRTEGADEVERVYPHIGSKGFSAGVAKYFGTVAYTYFKLGKHAIASSPTFKPSIITGSRLGIALEKLQAPSMLDILT